MNFTKILYDDAKGFHLEPNRVQWPALVNTVIHGGTFLDQLSVY
jgi:hypothetical protein